MKLAAAVLTGNSVLNSVLTLVNRVLKKIGYNCSSECLLYDVTLTTASYYFIRYSGFPSVHDPQISYLDLIHI